MDPSLILCGDAPGYAGAHRSVVVRLGAGTARLAGRGLAIGVNVGPARAGARAHVGPSCAVHVVAAMAAERLGPAGLQGGDAGLCEDAQPAPGALQAIAREGEHRAQPIPVGTLRLARQDWKRRKLTRARARLL